MMKTVHARASWLRRTAAVVVILVPAGLSVMTFTAVASGQDGHGHMGRQPATGAHTTTSVPATPEQQANAARLFEDVKAGIARFADLRAAQAEGYQQSAPFRFGDWGPAHFKNRAYSHDDRLLDPARPEGLVYLRLQDGRTVLLGAFFLAPRGQGPRPGGPITEWHFHNPDGQGEMMHVWIFGHPDGPFARSLTKEAIPVAMQYAARSH